MTVDDSGNFTVTTALPDGSYAWTIKGLRNLASAGELVLSSGSVSAEFGVQLAGDANNSYNINAQDFNQVKVSFGQSGAAMPADSTIMGEQTPGL